MTLNIDSDFSVMDGTQTATYHARLNDSTFAAGEAVNSVLARPATAAVASVEGGRNFDSAGSIATAEIVFHVWRECIAATPKVRDELTDADGVRWVVVQVETRSLATRYRIFCARKR